MDAKELNVVPFAQQRPADFTLLVYPPTERQNFSGQLVYQHPTTGERVKVPNIWYNQPLSWQAKYAEFLAERCEEQALKALRNGFKADATACNEHAKAHREMAAILRAKPCPIIDISNTLS